MNVATFPRTGIFDFTLPKSLEADTPPERRGSARDGVRMMVSHRGDGRLVDTVFDRLPAHLVPGDLLVVNTSGTLPAALDARLRGDREVTVHLSTRLPGALWTLELRACEGATNAPFAGGEPGMELELPGGARATLLTPFADGSRLWVADVQLGEDAVRYLARNGRAIRYSHVIEQWPIEDYQAVYATEPGSAEMPSAGRPFTPELITRLVAGGVGLAPLVLHTGVSSLEVGEAPYEEWYSVPADTARRVNEAQDAGGRIVAVGTTVVRALETVASYDGRAHPGEGWTGKVVTPEAGVNLVDGLLTGWHEPRASHLAMLEAIAGRELVERSYRAALEEGYLWHEFGDVHLVLP